MITLPTISPDQNIGELIANIYTFAIGIVGLAVFVQFLRAGFGYFGAAGNVSETSHAKEMMQNAILGTILLFSAYLILNVINPDLLRTDLFVIPSLSPVPVTSLGGGASGTIPINQDTVANSALGHGPNPVIRATVIQDALAKAGITMANGVRVDGMRSETINALLRLKAECSGCTLSLTKGTESFQNGDELWFKFNNDFSDAGGLESIPIKFLKQNYESEIVPLFPGTANIIWSVPNSNVEFIGHCIAGLTGVIIACEKTFSLTSTGH